MRNLLNCGVMLFLLVSGTAFSQDEKIEQTIIDESCACIGKIEYNIAKEKKNAAVKECIEGSIMSHQMKGMLEKLAQQTDSATITLVVDKDYDIIQKKLFIECAALKDVLSTNNEESKNSVSNKKKAKTFYDEGDNYYRKQQFDLAVVEYNKAVNADPKFAFAWDNMGMCYRKLGRYKQAIECYDKSLAIDPKGSMPLMNKAVAFGLMEDYGKSASAYETMISILPDDPEGYYGAGRMHYANGNHEKGVDYIFQAYLQYKKTDSPYVHDAESNIRLFYEDMKKNNELAIFTKVAKKYNVEIKE